MDERVQKQRELQCRVAADANSPEALCDLGWASHKTGEYHAAEFLFRRALEHDPGSLSALYGLGLICLRNGRGDEGIKCASVCIERAPTKPEYWSLLSKLRREEGLLEEAIRCMRKAVELAPGESRIAQRLLYQLLLSPKSSGLSVLREHQQWAAAHTSRYYPVGPVAVPPLPAGGRIRIGYVSPDWKNHPVAQFSESFLRFHDRRRFEVFCYSCCQPRSLRTQELSRLPEHWIEAAQWDDEVLSQRIRGDGIHILVDLAGHTRGGRPFVFACQSAPLQISFLGYPATTGIATIAYRITDNLADPPGFTEMHYTEKLVRLPRSAWCFTAPENTPPVNSLPFATMNRVTFGSFNRFSKASSQTLELWARTLRSVPESRLLLKSRHFRDKGVRSRVLARFAALDIPAERIELRKLEEENLRHLAAYHDVDIALDTFPYHGTATTCEALWMGVPVVSLAGTGHVSRVGVSLLSGAGIAEQCLANSPDEFVAKARLLAQDRTALMKLRQELRSRLEQSPLMNGLDYTRALETVFDEIWRRFNGNCGALS